MADFRQKKRIGDMLLEAGIITQEQLEDALEKNKTAHKKIGEMLVDLGYATEEAIGEGLATQLNIPFISLHGMKIEDDIIKLADGKLLRKHLMIPFEYKEGNVNIKVSIIGDSVALGARSSLRNNIKDSYVDTAGSRNLQEGYDIIMSLQESNTLGECVVVALGTNTCGGWESYIQKIINDIKPGHRLVFVTPYDGRWEEDWGSYKTTQYLRTLPGKYPFVTIADWAATISKKKELLGSDKIHIGGNTEGINMFTNVVIDAIKEAQGKPAK